MAGSSGGVVEESGVGAEADGDLFGVRLAERERGPADRRIQPAGGGFGAASREGRGAGRGQPQGAGGALLLVGPEDEPKRRPMRSKATPLSPCLCFLHLVLDFAWMLDVAQFGIWTKCYDQFQFIYCFLWLWIKVIVCSYRAELFVEKAGDLRTYFWFISCFLSENSEEMLWKVYLPYVHLLRDSFI